MYSGRQIEKLPLPGELIQRTLDLNNGENNYYIRCVLSVPSGVMRKKEWHRGSE